LHFAFYYFTFECYLKILKHDIQKYLYICKKLNRVLTRKQISIFILFAYTILIGHDLIPHHHVVGPEVGVTLYADHHADNDHLHLFSGIHTTHPAASAWEIIHFQYEQNRPSGQLDPTMVQLSQKLEFSPPELLQKPLRTNQSVIPIIEGITLTCSLRAPPVA